MGHRRWRRANASVGVTYGERLAGFGCDPLLPLLVGNGPDAAYAGKGIGTRLVRCLLYRLDWLCVWTRRAIGMCSGLICVWEC